MTMTDEKGLSVLFGYDPETGKSTADRFEERPEDEGETSPWHRAHALKGSILADFPGWIWSVGSNERGVDLMATENMRRMGLSGYEKTQG